MPRCEEAKSVTKEDTKLLRYYGTKVVSEINSTNRSNENLAVCTAAVTVGWDCEITDECIIVCIFSPRKRADCSLRAKKAHGGVEPAEHPVDPLNANENSPSRSNPAYK